jgi:hypothetical protein
MPPLRVSEVSRRLGCPVGSGVSPFFDLRQKTAYTPRYLIASPAPPFALPQWAGTGAIPGGRPPSGSSTVIGLWSEMRSGML